VNLDVNAYLLDVRVPSDVEKISIESITYCENVSPVIKFTFNPKKATQAGAILLHLHGNEMGNYCFIKMLYLADRESFERWGEPITGDNVVSMEHGPVLSKIYDLTKGNRPSLREFWASFISDADEANRVTLNGNPGNDELSPSEIKVLERIHEKFKSFTWKQMKDFCHDLPEYDKTVGKSSRPIRTEKILGAVGKSDQDIQDKEEELNNSAMVDLLFGSR
jgi:uncharacterized phage-associated protein